MIFCVVCGKETDEELRGGVCASCYLEKNALATIRDHVDVEICVHCHARKRGEIWMEGHGSFEPIIEDAVREAVVFEKVVDRPKMEVHVRPEDERNFSVTVRARGTAEGVAFDKELSTRSRVKNATCLRCSRVQGGYYESIVQVRAAKREMDVAEKRAIKALASKFIERVVQEGDRNAFVLRDEDADRGLDIYMGTTNSGRMLAKQIATEFGGKTTEHAKTVGQKDGLDLIRLTFAVRLPEYKAGDVVVLKEEPFLVSSIGGKTVQVTELVSGKLRHVERGEMERALVIPRHEALQAIVVSHHGNELQLMDPSTYATVTALKPEGMDEVGDTVEVIRHEGELLVLRPRKDAPS